MIQYKHASVAAFEGYAGTSASGFRAEIEAQRRLGQTDDLLDYFDRRQGGASLGRPAGPRIGRTLDDAAVQLGPLPAMIADRARLRVIPASVARTFHVRPQIGRAHARTPGTNPPLVCRLLPQNKTDYYKQPPYTTYNLQY